MAIIHTESNFNPKAKSHAKAVGLMQIIPIYAGRDAYKALYGEDKVLSQEYLYKPENNVELGCAYLNLLKNHHFKAIDGDVKRQLVTISGYNWGPTSMRRKIISKYPISEMSNQEVYLLLREKTPRETREYLRKVTERTAIYAPYFL